MTKCSVCQKINVPFYTRLSGGKRVNRRQCKKCFVTKQKKAYHKSKNDIVYQQKRKSYRDRLNTEGYFKKYRLEKLYGLTVEEYQKIIHAQNSQCAICFNILSKKSGIHIDHCHHTGIVRGILCRSCNTALGLFRDNLRNLRAAIEYLENHDKI